MRDTPIDIAAGLGALWVGGPRGRLSRIDPETGAVTGTVKLPDAGYQGDLAFTNWGFPQIAVGAGAVWAINPDRTVSRIDPETGKREATIDVDAATIAAGKEGVWFIDTDDTVAVTPIDPSTNRVGRPIRVGAQNLSAVAVGGGYVWASAEGDGLVWRIEPGRQPDTPDDRRRSRRYVPRLRRGGGLGGELQRRHRGAHRREDERRRGDAGRSRAGTGGRRGVGVGEHGRSDVGRRAARDVRPASFRRPAPRCADCVGPPAPGTARAPVHGPWRTRSGSCWSSATSGRGSTRSATAPATTRTRTPGTSTAAPARRTPTRTRARRSWSP